MSETFTPDTPYLIEQLLYAEAPVEPDLKGPRPMWVLADQSSHEIQEIQAGLDSYHRKRDTDETEPIELTPELQGYVEQAANFMLEATGIEQKPMVSFFDEQGQGAVGNASLNGTVKIFMGRFNSYSAGLQERAVPGVIIHEMAHALPGFRRRLNLIHETDEEKSYILSGANLISALQKHYFGISQRTEAFEEAFAESYGVEFREKYVYRPEHSDAAIYVNEGDTQIRLPLKYVVFDDRVLRKEDAPELNKNFMAGAAAYFVYCFDMLSEITGQDLIEQLRTIRLDEQESIAASRKMARILNAVEPGLYRKIRDCKYESGEMIKLVSHVSGLHATHLDTAADS